VVEISPTYNKIRLKFGEMFKYGFLNTLSPNFKVYDTCHFPMNLNLPPLPQLVIYFFVLKNDHALPLLPPSITRERDKKSIQPASLLGLP
jgi:hypothetical protein